VRKTLVLTLVLLVSAVWLQAQDAGKTSGKTADLDTIEGCLQSSGGKYTLTKADGTTVTLSSHANEMIHHVGHQVQVTGMPAVKTVDTTQTGTESSAKEIPVFRVQSIKHLADTCTTK
jgi:ABC-type transport system involved in cytochrome c biogenesis ATPase subunit